MNIGTCTCIHSEPPGHINSWCIAMTVQYAGTKPANEYYFVVGFTW